MAGGPRSRLENAEELVRLTGDRILIEEHRNDWPARATVRRGNELVPVSLHVGRVGLSHRGRDDVERRYQNPGDKSPVTLLAGTACALVIGIWDEVEQTVLVAHDARRRIGEPVARASHFVPLWTLLAAVTQGWAEHESGTGERIVAFLPHLFPVFFELALGDIAAPPVGVTAVAEAASPEPDAVERARRQTSVLVRDQRFRERVVGAYGGECAMCGLDLGLVQGAHIYPARAPQSHDEIWNGLALCANHHTAFDQHAIWVEPASLRLLVHPRLSAGGVRNATCATFVGSHYGALVRPADPAAHPRPEMFMQRYAFHEGKYAWAGAG